VAFLALVRRGGARELEIVVLRHQLAIFRRGGKRPQYTSADRALLAAASRLLPPERWSCLTVSQQTLRRWHRTLLQGNRRPGRHRLGRPPLAAETRSLIKRLARENPRWGYMRIQGELKGLGISVSATTVANVLRSAGLGPAPRQIGPSWSEFLRAQAHSLFGGGLRPSVADIFEADASQRADQAQDGQGCEVAADAKLASDAAEEPPLISHPLPVRRRRLSQPSVLAPSRRPGCRPQSHRSHARDGPREPAGAHFRCHCADATSKPPPLAPRRHDRTRRIAREPPKIFSPSASALRRPHSRIAARWRHEPNFFIPQQELPPADACSSRRGLDAVAVENAPNAARRQLDPERDQLALDALVSPAWVLRRQTQNQLSHLRGQRRPALPTPIVGPAATDKVTMPAQQRRWLDQEHPPPLPRQHLAERG